MKSERHANLAPLRKLFRSDITLDGQTSSMRLEILSNRHDVARDGAQVVHELDDFIKRLAQSDHDSTLRQHAAIFPIASRRSSLQKCQRLLVNRIGPDAAVQAGDGFGVVVKHVRLCVEHGVECGFVAVEVRNQNFDFAIGIESTYLSNRFSPVCGAAVRQIVAIDGSDNGMGEIQMIYCFGDMPRLLRIQRARLAFAHCTEATVARADVAAKHESGGAIRPALENVWAARFLADGVQVESFDQLQHLVLVGWVAQTDAQPFGLGLTNLLIVTDYSEFAGQLFTSERILQYKLLSSESAGLLRSDSQFYRIYMIFQD